MQIDARSLPNGQTLEADLCIVGAGPCGITLAHRLRNTGLKIILIESGGIKPSAETETLNDNGETGSTYAPLNLYRRRLVGGSSTIWGGRLVPFEPIDFEERDWAPGASWPITYDEVARYYGDATAYSEGGLPEYYADLAMENVPQFISGLDGPQILTQSLERFSPPTDFGRTYAQDLKLAPLVTLLTQATCCRINNEGQSGRIESVDLRTMDGAALNVRARVFVIASGGIETYRLLAASRDAHPDRFGGQEGPLGRYFMSHIEGSFPILALNDPSASVDWGFARSRDGVYLRRRLTVAPEVQRTQRVLNFVGRLHHPSMVNPNHHNPVLSAMFVAKSFILAEYRRKISMVERNAADLMPKGAAFWAGHFRNLILGSPRLAAFLTDWIARRYMSYRRIPYVVMQSNDGSYPIDFNAEQLPNPLSRLYQMDRADRFGVPFAAVDWKMTDIDVASVAQNLRILQKAVLRQGVGQLNLEQDIEMQVRAESSPVGGHHIGAARMSDEPSRGIVDKNLKVHGLVNLYVIGAAVLPTSSHANPTLTILALTLRLADLFERRRQGMI